MIRMAQLTLPIDGNREDLIQKAARQLGIRTEEILEFTILRQSIDARKKTQLQAVYTVELRTEREEQLVRQAKSPNITLAGKEVPYRFPPVSRRFERKPVIVGMGPAGLFSALFLARAGVPSILLERGRGVEERSKDVEYFWKTGELSCSSNVQFGEGGAGTFSDGKLTTGIRDIRARSVLQTLVEHGAPEDILYSHKPHVGTDVLRKVVKSIREELVSLGCEVRFEQQVQSVTIQDGVLCGITVKTESDTYPLDCDELILAPGHSARDTFHMLHEMGVPMEQKPFAIGVRIEHKQEEMSRAQFGEAYRTVPPSDYKLSCHLPTGRSAFTFCVCPGGEVVAASSNEGQVVTNGMSNRARDGENINGGFLVGVGPSDFPGDDPLAGVRFQEQWETAAWDLGGRNFHAPAQLVGDFLAGKASKAAGTIQPTYRPGVTWTDLSACLPDYVIQTLRDALPLFERKVHGFSHPDAVLTGVETRSSSPVRILRNPDTLESGIQGLYPCGEGAGYAGGIVSAAVDGIKVAEALSQRIKKNA